MDTHGRPRRGHPLDNTSTAVSMLLLLRPLCHSDPAAAALAVKASGQHVVVAHPLSLQHALLAAACSSHRVSGTAPFSESRQTTTTAARQHPPPHLEVLDHPMLFKERPYLGFRHAERQPAHEEFWGGIILLVSLISWHFCWCGWVLVVCVFLYCVWARK